MDNSFLCLFFIYDSDYNNMRQLYDLDEETVYWTSAYNTAL